MKILITICLSLWITVPCLAGQLSPNYPGIVALWHFNEASGTSGKDETANANHWTHDCPYVTGTWGNMVYNGTASIYDGRSTKNASTCGMTGDISFTIWAVATWVDMPDASGYKQIWVIGWGANAAGNRSMTISLFNGAFGFQNHWGVWIAGLNWFDSGYHVTANQKISMCITYNKDTNYMYAYTNGILTGQQNGFNVNFADTVFYMNTAFVGDSVGTKVFYEDELALFNRDLSAREVKQLHNWFFHPTKVGGN
jgi:hypothetical protein